MYWSGVHLTVVVVSVCFSLSDGKPVLEAKSLNDVDMNSVLVDERIQSGPIVDNKTHTISCDSRLPTPLKEEMRNRDTHPNQIELRQRNLRITLLRVLRNRDSKILMGRQEPRSTKLRIVGAIVEDRLASTLGGIGAGRVVLGAAREAKDDADFYRAGLEVLRINSRGESADMQLR